MAMTTIIVLFNLKEPASRTDYERWAREVDLPAAGGLPSVDRFEVLRSAGLFGGGTPPYQYIEIVRVNDMDQFGKDVATEVMQKVAGQFQAFADKPLFILTEAL